MKVAPVFLSMSLFISSSALSTDRACVVPEQGYFRIHVGTSGLFGGFAHEHLIEAQRIEGCADISPSDLTHSSVKLSFMTAAIQVIDPTGSKDRDRVQKTMETEVLHVSEFPQITFESTKIDSPGSTSNLRMQGSLTIRDKTQPVVVPLDFTHLPDGTYRAVGRFNFKQTSFGIKPIQLIGGTVKVKDELETEFEIFLK